jgi:hypothetical protein
MSISIHLNDLTFSTNLLYLKYKEVHSWAMDSNENDKKGDSWAISK